MMTRKFFKLLLCEFITLIILVETEQHAWLCSLSNSIRNFLSNGKKVPFY